MPTVAASPDLRLHYLVDDFTDPWTEPETILLLHGNCESSLAWYAWVPMLARRFRVVRPDMRGYGASTPMPRDFTWSLEVVIDDYARLMDFLGVPRFHLVGAKIGGVIAGVRRAPARPGDHAHRRRLAAAASRRRRAHSRAQRGVPSTAAAAWERSAVRR